MSFVKNFISIMAAVNAVICLIFIAIIMCGYRPFILKTGSMEPLYAKGSLCWINTHYDIEALKIGDVLVYRSPVNTLVLHRLIRKLDAERKFIMQGDANSISQTIELSKINFIGKEAFTIPYLGTMIDKTHGLIWLMIMICLLLACVPIKAHG